jgi:hypothetical protein
MNGKAPIITTTPPFVLRFSEDKRRVFQQNQGAGLKRLVLVGPAKNEMASIL